MPAAPLPVGRSGRLHSLAPWGWLQRQDEGCWCRREAVAIPAVGLGTDTHQKVTIQESQGQARTSNLV